MSVTSQVPYKNYIAAPGATVFATDFRLMFDSDLIVSVDSVVVTSGFTLSGVRDIDGAEVTFSSPMAGGELVELQRSIPFTRDTDYQQLGDFLSPVVNDDFDRIVMMIQDQQLANAASVLLPLGDAQSPMTLPTVSERANLFLAFDAAGAAIAAAGSAGTPISGFMTTVVDDTDAPSARGTLGAAASGANTDITSLSGLASVNGGQLAGLRNFLINGGMQVGQRGSTVFSATNNLYGWVDRWLISISGTTVSALGYQDNVADTATGYALQVGNVTTTGATVIGVSQRIEAINSRKLNNRTVTLSARVHQDTGSTQTLTIGLHKATAGVDSWGTQAVIASATASIPSGVWTDVSFTTTLGASDCNNGISAVFNYNSLAAVTNKQFRIGNCQLEIGSVVTSFEHRDYGLELALCQRYYEEVAAHAISTAGGASQYLAHHVSYKATKRAAVTPTIKASPTVTNFNYAGFSTVQAGSSFVYGTSAAAGTCEFVYTLAVSAEL